MTTETDEFRNSLVAAVQAELERHASAVVAEVDRLREEGRRERAELRSEFTEQVSRLAQAIEQIDARSAGHAEKVQTTMEQRLAEAEQRSVRRIDDSTSGLPALVQDAIRPVATDLRDEHEAVVGRVETLDRNLRKFDEQAARMVTYFNDMSQQMEQRQDELVESVQNDVKSQIDTLKQLVDENDSAVRKFQNEVGLQVSTRLNDAEDRFNNRLLTTENRIKEDAGQKIAEIDLHVSRVSGNLDESLAVMNDRIAAIDDRFVELDRKIAEVEESIEGVDQSVLDEMREKMSAAAGEAMLVRIEMERLEKGVNEKTDTLAVRLTEVETSLQDATLDVSTAVQLDRLEHIERSLAELDPDQFVRKDGRDAPESATAPPSQYGDDSGGSDGASIGASLDAVLMADVESPSAPPPPPPPAGPPLPSPSGDEAPPSNGDGEPKLPGGIDIGAIIAAAEAASDHDES